VTRSLPYWSWGRVTLLGDAAIRCIRSGPTALAGDPRCALLADALARSEHPRQALLAYEQKRLR